MKFSFKIAGYVAFTIGMVVFAILFYSGYSRDAATAPPPEHVGGSEGDPPVEASRGGQIGYQNLVAYGLGFLGCAIGLGLLLARDVSEQLGSRAVKLIYNDEGEGQRDADYEACEVAVNNGEFMEAIRMLREYLKNHPRRQYAALRIAELYETNLHNPLAAALEYEEVLKHPLPPERWGWAAIHLANLYSGKLNRTDEAVALLHRIVKEQGQTAAGKKARERLGLPEEPPPPPPGAAPAAAPAEPRLPAGFRAKSEKERDVHADPVSETLKPLPVEAAAEPAPAEPAPAEPNLPPGFRPKKG